MKKFYLILLILSVNTAILKAQDIHFSQYNENASLINPALIGQASAIKASLIYRDQWRSVTVPYKTYGAEVEARFMQKNWKKQGNHATRKFKKAASKMAAGISFFSDLAGDGNMGTTQANLTLSSNIPVTRKSSLALGLQASYVQRKIDYTKLIWPDQYTGTGYDQTLMSGENVSAGNFTYPDFAAGMIWSYGYTDRAIGSNDQFKMDVGVSVYHFNSPKLQFLAATDTRLLPKEVVHGKFLIGIENSNISLLPSYLVQFQGSQKEIIVGCLVRYAFKSDSKYTGNIQASHFGLGFDYRNSDGFVARTQYEFRNYAIGFSYDLNTSELRTASNVRGGFEVFLHFNARAAYLYQNK